jgi:ATP-binding cassette subfamily A (ABC1) protein 3
MNELDDYNFELSRMGSFNRFTTHMKILMWKKLMYSKRDIKGLLLEIIIPCLIIAMGCSLLTVQFVNE